MKLLVRERDVATRLIDELYARTTGRPAPTRDTHSVAASRRETLRERDIFRALALAD